MARLITVRNRQGKEVEVTVGLTARDMRVTPRSRNRKTGNIPQVFVGRTLEETRETCTPCALYDDGSCYAQYGQVAISMRSIETAHTHGKDHSLRGALAQRHKTARAVRTTALGDPGSLSAGTWRWFEHAVRGEAELAIIGYTHQWYLPHAQYLKGKVRASVDTKADMVEALEHGWQTAIHIDKADAITFGATMADKPHGTLEHNGATYRYTYCPAQRNEDTGRTITCNDCLLCDATRTKVDIVVFADHGKGMDQSKARKAKASAAPAPPGLEKYAAIIAASLTQ